MAASMLIKAFLFAAGISLALAQDCDVDADVGFILDSSHSIENFYDKEKNFLNTLAASFGIGSGKSRASVVTFSSWAELSIKFNAYDNLQDFQDAVMKIPHMNYKTAMDKALRLAQAQMFTTANGARAGKAKLLIMLTDGENTGGEDPDIAVRELRQSGINVMVIGMGPLISKKTLIKIAGGKQYVYLKKKFNKLFVPRFLGKVKATACDAAEDSLSLPTKAPATTAAAATTPATTPAATTPAATTAATTPACTDRTTAGDCCVFPFIYQGTSYNSCADYGNYKWCATTDDYATDKKWGKCQAAAATTPAATTPAATTPAATTAATTPACTEPTTDGNANGACCVFPFIFKGTSYNSCADYSNYKWCATTDNYDTDKKWGKCPADCPAADTDYNGNDIKLDLNVASWDDCRDKCKANAKCKFFTFVQESGCCYHKSAKGDATTAPGLISGSRDCPK